MPEGDAVYYTARRLRGALDGRVLVRSDFRVPRYATVDLTGRVVHETVSRGKHLLTRVEGGVTVHTHLRMDGTWRVLAAGRRPPPGDVVRVVLGNAEWTAVGIRLGMVDLLPSEQEHRVVGHLGPDLLGAGWDAAEAVRRLAASPDRAVGDALLDQRNLAGIGTIYRAETLFLAGVQPWRPVGEVRDLAKLVGLAHRLLTANKDRPGVSTTGDLRRGRELWVYGRAGRPCLRCGTRIVRGQLGGLPSLTGGRGGGTARSLAAEQAGRSTGSLPDDATAAGPGDAGQYGTAAPWARPEEAEPGGTGAEETGGPGEEADAGGPGLRGWPRDGGFAGRGEVTAGGRRGSAGAGPDLGSRSQERLVYWCPVCQPP